MTDKLYRIKPLVWHGRESDGMFEARPLPQVCYSVMQYDDGWWCDWIPQQWGDEVLPTLAEAKAAAELHYRETIAQALEEVPCPT